MSSSAVGIAVSRSAVGQAEDADPHKLASKSAGQPAHRRCRCCTPGRGRSECVRALGGKGLVTAVCVRTTCAPQLAMYSSSCAFCGLAPRDRMASPRSATSIIVCELASVAKILNPSSSFFFCRG